MNAKMIEALKQIQTGVSVLIKELENDSSTPAQTTKEATAPQKEVFTKPEMSVENTPAPNKSRKEREASETLPDASEGLTREQLDGLSYNNLKRLAKEMGIPATGARDELTEKILNYDGEVPAPDSSDEVETAPAKSSPVKNVKKNEPVEEPGVDESEEEETDSIEARVNEAVAEMTNEEIADLLADVGVKAKGKRQSLISAVVQAVIDGKIDLDDEDESEEEATATDSAEEEEEFDVNDTSNPDMTKERKAAIEAYTSEVQNDFKEGSITRADLIEWLNEYHGTKDSMKKKTDKELLSEYIHFSCLLINDEGEMPEEEGAYTVNGVPYCCGHELSYNEDNETYICETCGAEYEAE